MIVYDREQKQIVIPNGLGNVNIVINQGCDDDKPTPPQDGWGMTGYFNDWGGTPDIPFEEDGELEGRPYKVIRNFEATGGEFKIRRNNAWTDSYTARFRNIPQFAKLIKGDSNMSINDGVWDIYLFFGDDGVPNEMLVLNPGTDLSTIQYEYTLNLSADKESAIFLIGDSFDFSAKNYYGGNATIPMKYGCIYSINVSMEGYEDIFEEITCYSDEERSYTLTKIEGYGCNLINPIVFSKEAGNTINAENVQIPTFVYEGNQYYNVESFNLADIEDFKIHILFKPNNSGDAEPINIFGCEDTDWDDTTFGARIYQGQIYFKMSGEDMVYSYTENTWYDVEMGYNTTKKWVIVNGETLLDAEYASFNKPSQTLMIGAINSGGNAFRPFYGKIAAIYVEPNGGQVWLLPKENGTMAVYWNNRNNSRNSISGENNARFENDSISGDGMKSITWLGNLEDKWVTPSMSERDGNGYIVVSPSEGYNGLSRTVINPQTLYNEGYGQGKTDGANEQKSKLETINITENGTYTKEDGYNHIEVNVPDLNGSYDEGYAQGKIDGINEQKGKLESINITENGTYRKEDGYNEVVVNVPDLNGSYDEGYEQGQADSGANARVLNVTENGVYRSKFSDPIPPTVTGVYADGTEFYNCAELNGKIFNTKITPTENSRLEFWYKGDNKLSGNGKNVIIGAGNADNKNCFRVRYNTNHNDLLDIGLGNSGVYVYDWDDTVWHHLIVSKAEGVWVDGEKQGNFAQSDYIIEGEFYINGIRYDADGTNIANGTFGMIKIDDTTIIPTANGFLNTNTGELLEVVKDGSYTYTEGLPTYGEGELYKTINVNIATKINLQKTGLKLGYSTFTEVPEWADFEGVTNMEGMFYKCSNLQNIPQIDTSKVTNMKDMFSHCNGLAEIPLFDTSNVTNMDSMFENCGYLYEIPQLDTSNVVYMEKMFSGCWHLHTIPLINTSNVTNMINMFDGCTNLETIPQIDTSNVTNMSGMFNGCERLRTLPALNAQSLTMKFYTTISGIFGNLDLRNLRDFGGFLNLKCSLTGDNNLKRLTNLTYESCINVLNGLYDFTGNGETPSSEQGKLTVSEYFLFEVGDEISIARSKGWVVSAE